MEERCGLCGTGYTELKDMGVELHNLCEFNRVGFSDPMCNNCIQRVVRYANRKGITLT